MSFFYSQTGPKVLDVKSSLPVLTPYLPSLRDELIARLGGQFQEPDPGEERTWTLLENWEGELLTDSGIIRVRAFKGWNLDFASIPDPLESFEKRDDRSGLIAAFFHDAFFAVQYPTFEVANSLFYQIGRFYGMSKFRSWRRWKAVSSDIGFGAWEKSSAPEKVFDELRFLSVVEVPK
jgi:hypothetical protein